MLASEILERLSACGVQLARDGDGLRAFPKSALTDDMRRLIREHKAELLAALPIRHQHANQQALEIRRLLQAIATANATYWTAADVEEEACFVAQADLDSALTCWRAIAERYGLSITHKEPA